MKNPKQKNKYRGAGFAVRAAFLAVLAVGCLAMCCSFTHAWFVTERGVNENQVELATYGVTVYDAENNELAGSEYLCPLAPEDLHYFTLKAEGTAYTGHCLVEVTPPASDSKLESDNEAESYVIELAPDRSGMVGLQAAKGSLLNFSFDWGTGENPVEPASAFGREDVLLFYIEHTRTPHLIYEVAYGASLAGIANYYNIPVEDLCAYNDLDTDFKGSLEGEVLAIPYVESHPEGGPYVPKGDLVVTIENAGDTVTPDDACVVIKCPDGSEIQVRYADFDEDSSYLLEGLPAGEYQFTMLDAEKELYTLETSGNMSAVVSEDAETESVITNTYTRHVGDCMIWVEEYGCDIPVTANVVLYGPEDTYEIPYYMLAGGFFTQRDLPTGEYTIALEDAEVENYTLTADDVVVEVKKDKTTYTQVNAEYERHVGNLVIWLEAEGYDIPEEAVVVLYGPEDVYEIPYAWFQNDAYYAADLPTGEYTVVLEDAEVEDYSLTVYDAEEVVKKDKTTYTQLSAEYERHVGDLAIWVEVDGHDVPEDAVVVLYGPDDTYEIPYARFRNDSYYAEGLPTGEYTVVLEDAEVEDYSLTVYDAEEVVKKDKTTYTQLSAEYERQLGNLEIRVEAEGCAIPGDAVVVLYGPDDTYEIPYAQFQNSSYYMRGLPTGKYVASLSGAEKDGYTLTADDVKVYVEWNKSAYMELLAAFVRDVGDLTITVQVSGASLPDGAWLEVYGPDGYGKEVACESCTLTDLPTGEYSIYVEGVDLDGYDVDVKDAAVSVTKKGANAQVSITYTMIETAPEEEPSTEETTPVEQETPLES